MRVIGNEAPSPVTFFLDLSGQRYARLARNIEQDWRDAPEGSEGEPQEFYTWDEVEIGPTTLTQEEIESSFDSLFYGAERGMMTEDEWKSDVDSALLDLMEMVVG